MSDRLRSVCGLAVLAVVVVGSTARSHVSLSFAHASTNSAASGVAGAVLLGAGLVVLIALGAVAAFERRRGKRRTGVVARRRPWLQALVMFVIVFGTVLARRAVVSHHSVEDKATPRVPSPQVTVPARAPQHSSAGSSVAALALVLAILALCAAFIWWRSWRRRGHPVPANSADDVLQQALRDGAAALHDVADPRQAIVACYVAMRATLVAAGIVVRPSDTATQMLVRASAAPVNLPAAQQLTDLFLEARYSAHPIGDDAREAAVVALNELQYGRAEAVSGAPV